MQASRRISPELKPLSESILPFFTEFAAGHSFLTRRVDRRRAAPDRAQLAQLPAVGIRR